MDSNNLFVKVSIQDLVKIDIQRDVIEQLVSEYEFGERSIYDLYAKPLLVTVRDALEILITWGRGGSINALIFNLAVMSFDERAKKLSRESLRKLVKELYRPEHV